MGMVNQLGKFSPNIAELSKPLREVLSKQNAWTWGNSQTDSFNKIKAELASSQILAWYNPTTDTKLVADASAYGLGAVLLQKHESDWKPVVYASKSMTETETRYAQIEKRLWLLPGLVSASLITYWGNSSILKQITNYWFHSWEQNSLIAYHPEYSDSDFILCDLTIQYLMFLESYYTQQTLCLIHLKIIQLKINS